ncbi:MAG: hypothetical protein K6F69_05495 [Treponema sp.]|nr:hypothetical protein [Treponema sp.]
MKNCFLLVMVMVCLPVFLQAKSNRVESKNVEKMDSWQEEFDLENKKPGKYNILVTVDDKGGNTQYGGPFNIYVDPESDLPVTKIANPLENMEVTGNLNIVGVCADDDAVEYVELILDGDAENPVRAEGKEFWSYYLDTNDLFEGLHTIDAYGVDINGLKGHAHHISWQLNRRQPTTQVTNHTMGQLVSGKINLSGEVKDGNGIKSLSYSIDGGKTFLPAKIKEEKYKAVNEEGLKSHWNFKVPVDTTKLPDGPTVIWFRASDNFDTENIYSFLYFIDNTAPEVKVVYPKTGSINKGKFTVAGYAKDTLGVKKLTWRFGSESGEFELVPGNPYWVKDVDTVGRKEKSMDFIVTASDESGNVTTVKHEILLNQELDRPILSIQTPFENMNIEHEKVKYSYLRGLATDDDGVAEIRYKIDGGEVNSLSSEGAFFVLLPELTNGKHSISVTAIDKNGVESHEQTVLFNVLEEHPLISAAYISNADGNTDFSDGMLIESESNAKLVTDVTSFDGLERVWYTFTCNGKKGEENDIVLKPGVNKVNVNIPFDNSPWGIVEIEINAKNINGKIYTEKYEVNVKDLTHISVFDTNVFFSDSTVSPEGVVVCDVEHPISGYFVGGVAEKVEIVPETPFAKASLAGNSIVIHTTSEEGKSESVKVVVTTNQGLKYESRPLTFVSASEETNPIKAWFSTVCGKTYLSGMTIPLSYQSKKELDKVAVLNIQTNEVITEVLYSITGPEAHGGDAMQNGKAELVKNDDGSYEAKIYLYNLPSRLTGIVADIKTKSGASARVVASISVVREKDAELIDNSNKVYWIKHEALMRANDSIEAYANVPLPVKAQLNGKAEGLELSVTDSLINIVAKEDGVYDNISLTVEDANGIKYTTDEISFTVNTNEPVISIENPISGRWIQNTVQLSGKVSDTVELSKLEYSLDGGLNWKELPATKTASYELTFGTELDVSSLEDGLLGIDIRATNSCGRTGYAATAVQKDTIAPEAEVIIPESGDVINGENIIAFLVKDAGLVSMAEYAGDMRTPMAVSMMPNMYVGTSASPLKDDMEFDFTDASGNVLKINKYDFIIDAESDLPVSEIHLPEENAVMTRDFVISGVIYDDDGPCSIYWKIDDNEYQKLDGMDFKYSIDIPIKSLTDNEHVITVYAEDLHGVKGHEVQRPFRVSLEEPKGEMTLPLISTTVRDMVTLEGTASDKNGISLIEISIDNGNTYNKAVAEYSHEKQDITWKYTFDTNVVPDGTHVVFIRITDWYGIKAFYSSMLTTDNTSPYLNLELPLDGSKTSGTIFLSGQTTDNLELKTLYVNISSLEGNAIPEELKSINLKPDSIITQAFDISSLNSGVYNIELVGTDAAGNITRISRNVGLDKESPVAEVSLLYPLNGQHLQGDFNIYGQVESEHEVGSLELLVDNVPVAVTKLSESGYYKFSLGPDAVSLTDGIHSIQVAAVTEKDRILSPLENIEYTALGCWVTIDNFASNEFVYGDFAYNRPYLRGRAGYVFTEDDIPEEEKAGLKKKEIKELLSTKEIESIEISFDNGRTFKTVAKNKNEWKYRIENEDMKEGFHFILVKATAIDGATSVTRAIVQIDHTKPTVRLIAPDAGGRYNQKLEFSGLAADNIGLKRVTLSLRKGDKGAYEIPGFIQGLYFDSQFWGATLFNVGVGLTFFDDNVKLQAQWGQFTQSQRNMFRKTNMRYGGSNVMGLKILANVGYLPFRSLFGPDWSWLSSSLAIGANFTRFDESGSGEAQILSALIAQLEFPKVTIYGRKMFRTFSLYTEPQLWFIPSDISSSGNSSVENMVFQISVGARVNVF